MPHSQPQLLWDQTSSISSSFAAFLFCAASDNRSATKWFLPIFIFTLRPARRSELPRPCECRTRVLLGGTDHNEAAGASEASGRVSVSAREAENKVYWQWPAEDKAATVYQRLLRSK